MCVVFHCMYVNVALCVCVCVSVSVSVSVSISVSMSMSMSVINLLERIQNCFCSCSAATTAPNTIQFCKVGFFYSYGNHVSVSNDE